MGSAADRQCVSAVAAVRGSSDKRTIPGVVISDALLSDVREARDGRMARRFFSELAAKQLAIFRGLGFAGGYLGGVHAMEDVQAVLDTERTFGPDDWRHLCAGDSVSVER
jgi:hypothetical protein